GSPVPGRHNEPCVSRWSKRPATEARAIPGRSFLKESNDLRQSNSTEIPPARRHNSDCRRIFLFDNHPPVEAIHGGAIGSESVLLSTTNFDGFFFREGDRGFIGSIG